MSASSRLLTLAILAAGLAPLPAKADFQDCLAGLRAQAGEAGVSAQTFDRQTQGLQPNPDVIAASVAQPEFKTPIWDYLAGLVDEERVNDGKARLRQWHQAFAAAQQRFGVDAATIAAVWGVESNFGMSFGTKPVVQSLATLSCEGRRQPYFRKELFAALKIIQSGDIDPAQFTGSWAGAFGNTQFMPSTFVT
jgi:membrane-bound lytic murein transglycosylase B